MSTSLFTSPLDSTERGVWLQSLVRSAVLAVLIPAVAQTTFAQGLNYVDADDFVAPNLTTSSGDPLGDAIDQFNVSTDIGGDGLWRFRGADSGNMFGAGGTVYEASNGEDAQELIQTVSGLTSGTSYDMYIVWWSATNESWVLRGGISSNPGGNQIYDRTGLHGVPGQLGVFSNWTSPPADNLDIADGFPGLEGATLEGNRVMLAAKVGTATANGSGEVQVFVDDAMDLVPGHRAWFDGVAYAPAGANTNSVTATIDRTTGNLTITSAANYDISAVTINSASGAIDPSAWSSITGNLDAGSSAFDGDAWEITSMTANSLAENEVDRDPDPEVVLVDGGVFGPGGVATLDFGDIWITSPFEDIVVNVTLNGSGFTVPIDVTYTGGTPILLGDFDTDGDIDVEDYAVVLRGLNQSQAGLTDLESYARGDVTGNQQTNFNDLVRFRELYDDFNGPGAFALLTGVPEPSSLLLCGLGLLALVTRRRAAIGRALAACLLCCVAFLAGVRAEAQITYIDADLSSTTSSNVSTSADGMPLSTTNLGGWTTRGAGAVLTDGVDDTANFGNNGNILQALRTEAVDELAIDFTIPAAGSYDIYAFWWETTDNRNWNVQAGLSSGNLMNYSPAAPGIFPGGFTVDATTQVSGGPQEVLGLNVLGQTPDDYSDFVDGNRVLLGAIVGIATVADGGNVTVFIDHDETFPGGDARTFFDGVGYAVTAPRPTIEVNTDTGEVTFVNPTDSPVDFSYYEISSAAGSLNPTGWNSLDAQNFDAVDGDDEGDIAGDSLLEGWDIAGPTGLQGDYNEDGTVDSIDYAVWREGLGTEFTTADFDVWSENYGATGSAGGGTSGLLNETNFLNVSTLAAEGGSVSLGAAFSVGGVQDLVFSFGTIADGQLTQGIVKYVTSGSATGTPEPAALLLTLYGAIGVAASRRRS